MLTLTRKAGESIMIGDSIRVTVREVRGRSVQIAIDAPAGVTIFREEIYRAIEAENRAAAAAATATTALPTSLRGASIRLAAPVARGEEEP